MGLIVFQKMVLLYFNSKNLNYNQFAIEIALKKESHEPHEQRPTISLRELVGHLL